MSKWHRAGITLYVLFVVGYIGWRAWSTYG